MTLSPTPYQYMTDSSLQHVGEVYGVIKSFEDVEYPAPKSLPRRELIAAILQRDAEYAKNDRKRRYAHPLVDSAVPLCDDCGVDLTNGSHPHCIQLSENPNDTSRTPAEELEYIMSWLENAIAILPADEALSILRHHLATLPIVIDA